MKRRLSWAGGWRAKNPGLYGNESHGIRGIWDRALLGVLVTCALRRGELSPMNCEHLAMRVAAWATTVDGARGVAAGA